MYRRIVAAVNEYTNSEVAARYALALARACRAPLTLFFVAEAGMKAEAFRRAEAALGRLFREAERQEIDVESITERGEPFAKIRDAIERNRADILFASTRREDLEKRFFQRTLAKALILNLPCSVALVRVVHMGRVSPKNILVPLRGRMVTIKEPSCFVAKLAEAFDAKITLFHLAEPIAGYFHGAAHLAALRRESGVPKDIESFAECLRRFDVTHEKKIRYGDIAREITIEAAHKRNDLIVMGASERSLVRSIMGGNPVETVLRETPCNLIVFKPWLIADRW